MLVQAHSQLPSITNALKSMFAPTHEPAMLMSQTYAGLPVLDPNHVLAGAGRVAPRVKVGSGHAFWVWVGIYTRGGGTGVDLFCKRSGITGGSTSHILTPIPRLFGSWPAK